MPFWRQIARGVRALSHREATDQDVADEIQDYLERATAEHLARGLSPEEARRRARLEVGNVTETREQVRGYGWENLVDTLFADLRYGARRLARAPGFTAVIVLTLALGIGATTAIFSAVDPVLFEPLPYPGAGRILTIHDYGTGGASVPITFGTYRELALRSRSFQALAAFKPWLPTLTGPAEPERLEGQRVGADYFRALGVPPLLGRDFDPQDDRPQGGNVAILSDGLWRRRFGADPGIVGRAVTLDGNLFTIIGVMPPSRTFDNVLAPSTEIWTLLQYDASLSSFDSREWGHHLDLVGRLAPGVSLDQCRRDIAQIAATPGAGFARPPWASLRNGLQVVRLQDEVTRGVRTALLSMFGAVLLVLLIACSNVTNLLVARGTERRGEFAIRSALGAGGARLVRQLLTESVLLALLGGAAGIVVAQLGIQALLTASPADLPRIGAIHLGGSAFAFALGITTVIGLAVGSLPALHAARGDLHPSLQESSHRTAGGPHLMRRVLVVAEVSLALVLLVGAGLMVHSMRRLLALPTGFDPSQVITMQVQVAGSRFGPDSVTQRFFAQALEAVRQVPAIEEASFTSQLPLSGGLPDQYGVGIEANEGGGDAQRGDPALRYVVSPAYFAVMRIPLKNGRLLDRSDEAGPPAVVINDAFARRAFPGVNPLGHRLRLGPDTTWKTVVGVVGDVKQSSLTAEPDLAFYVVPTRWAWADQSRWLVARVRGGGNGIGAGIVPAIKRAIWSVDKDQPIVRVAPMSSWVATATAVRRFAMLVFELFALVALLLAGTGIYGILAGSVTERSREIGVRSALGATRRSILTMVVRQGMTLTLLGAGIGLIAAIVASRAITALLYEVSLLDPFTYVVVMALLLGVAVVACWVPAWRASRVDPVIALRAE